MLFDPGPNVLTHKRTIPLLLALIAAVFVIWRGDPNLDLRLSAQFYQNGRFLAAAPGIIQTLRTLFWDMALAMAWAALAARLVSQVSGGTVLGVTRRDWNIILWGFLLGPGLLVNGILKTFSGRARPQSVLDFGGHQFFTPIGRIADQCVQNCSFVSGEVSGTTATCIALSMILSAHAKHLSHEVEGALHLTIWASFVFVFWQRIASGGHFVSDAVLAALFTALVMAILARFWPAAPATP